MLSGTRTIHGQDTLPDNFTIGDFVELYASDSIKVYFNCAGWVTARNCAAYYRVGKIDTERLSTTGPFHDYFLNGKLYLEGTIRNGLMEGPAQYYYSNGQLKETGQYKNGSRTGKWTFYYPNGNIQKVYLYENDIPLVLEAFSADNKQLVKNGNGHFKTEFSGQDACIKFETEGDLINGKRSGPWTFSNVDARQPISEELYDDGTYIKSRAHNNDYIERPNTGLYVRYGNENIKLITGSAACLGYQRSSSLPKLIEGLQAQFDTCSLTPRDQWLVIGLKTGKKNNLLSLNVASSVNDTALEQYIYNTIINIKKWESDLVNGKKAETDFFFTIFTENHKIFVSEYISKKAFRLSLGLP